MKRGFTLIELLAVIVILAIIALIATPIVLNIINDSKESATLRSAEMYIDALENQIMLENMKQGGSFNPSKCQVTNQKVLCDGKEIKLEVDGEVPNSGSITFENGKLTSVNLKYENGNVTLNNKGQFVLGESAKVCEITLDKDNDGVAETGDMITCLAESFHVISNDGEQISMLAQYNLDVGYVCEFDTSIDACSSFVPIESPTGIQNSDAKGYLEGSSRWYGVLPFSTTNYWWNNDNSTFIVDTNYESEGREYPFVYGDYKNANGEQQNVIYPYVKAYEEYLKGENVSSAEATLISYEQLTQLGCDPENYSCSEENNWVYTTSYWSGSAYDYVNVWNVSSDGGFDYGPYDGGIGLGVRPVVNIFASEL